MNKWISVDQELPKGNCLARYVSEIYLDNQRIVKAQYIKRWWIETSSDDDECCEEYSEKDDTYYLKEGWYEVSDNSDYHLTPIHQGEVTHWMEIPKFEGENND